MRCDFTTISARTTLSLRIFLPILRHFVFDIIRILIKKTLFKLLSDFEVSCPELLNIYRYYLLARVCMDK